MFYEINALYPSYHQSRIRISMKLRQKKKKKKKEISKKRIV